MSRFIKRLNRWRHSRGFGVHSPFAYSLVCDVVRPNPRYGYYGYHDIERAVLAARVGASSESRLIRRACLLLRCVAALRPGSVWLPPSSPAGMTVAVEKGGSKPAVSLESCELMVVTDPSEQDVEVIRRHIAVSGHSLLVFGTSGAALAAELGKVMTDGLVLYGLSTLLAVNRADMPLVIHAVNFS